MTENAFNDGKRYEQILNSMREVKNVGEGNREYVSKLVVTTEDEVLGLVKRYCSHKIFEEYFEENKRLTGMLGERTIELGECTLN